MAKTFSKHLGLLLVLFLVAEYQFALPSAARVLRPWGFLPVLDGVVFAGDIIPASEAEGKQVKVGWEGGDEDHHAAVPAKKSSPSEVFAGKYGSLVLNALPKGRVPASGPGRKSNDIRT